MKNRFYISTVMFCLLTGCMSKNVPPIDTYSILPEWSNSKIQKAKQKKSSLIIKLAPVRATQALTTTEILYTDTHYGWNGYTYSRWNDSPVKLLQTLFQVSIEGSGVFKTVVPPTSVSKADLLLESTLLDLSHHIKDDGTSEGVIRVRFYLINNTTRTVTATREFVSRIPVSSPNAQNAVTALNKAAINVARDLISWLTEPGRF